MLIASPVLYFTPVSVSTFFDSRCLFFFFAVLFWPSLRICVSLSPAPSEDFLSLPPSLSLFLRLSSSVFLSCEAASQQCLPLLLHPCLLLVFLIRWQYIQGFFFLVFLTVTLHLDKTENKRGGRVEGKKKQTPDVPANFPSTLNESTKQGGRRREGLQALDTILTPFPPPILPHFSPTHPALSSTSSKNTQLRSSNTRGR